MDIIIGRDKEKKELEEAYNSQNAEFIAVYGRRRVGKTYLIRNYLQSKKSMYFQVTGIYKGLLSMQLDCFFKELGASFYQGASIKPAENWMGAFEILTQAMNQLAKNKKIVLFFDELPWMVTRKSGVLLALEYFWNRYWVNDRRIKLVVCGSAASWIIKKIIKNRGGLHNRVTRRIKLLPFDLKETASYLEYKGYSCAHLQVARLYMVMGGIPFYLNGIKKNKSIEQNIDTLFFNSEGILFDEFDDVFSSLFEDADQYREIVTLIASCRDGIARVNLDEKIKLNKKGGRLSGRLEDLEYAGFIASYIPYGHKKLGIFYKISDEYCYFYLKWLAPIKKQLKQDQARKYWKSIVDTPAYFSWLGYAFENVCYKHVQQIKSALEIDETSLASPWRYVPRRESKEQGAQIDLLFYNTRAIVICEIKWTEQLFVIDKNYSHQLKERTLIFKKADRIDKQIFLGFITTVGIKDNIYSKESVNFSVTLDDLFL